MMRNALVTSVLLLFLLLTLSQISCDSNTGGGTAAGTTREDTGAGSSTATTAAPDTAGTGPSAGFDTSRLGTVQRDIMYGEADGVPLKLDIYYPKTAPARFATVIYVHGGGWTAGDKQDGAGSSDIPGLVSAGFLVVAVDYRLAPEYKFPAQIDDVKTAVRFLRANAATFNIDPGRIGAWGGSAGGHLVSLLGVTDDSAEPGGDGSNAGQSSRVQAVVDMFGPSDLTRDFAGGAAGTRLGSQVFGTTDPGSPVLIEASPVTHVTPDDPPFLILQGEEDDLVPPSQSQELFDRLKSAGVPATLVMVKNAGHGFRPAGGEISPSRQQITAMIVDFFLQNL